MNNQNQVQKQVSTQAISPSIDITHLIMPISYAVSGAIALSAIAAFLRQLFNLGRE
jgi:hypothetical protein